MVNKKPASFKSSTIIYYALFIGQAFMGGIIFFVKSGEEMQGEVLSPYNMLIPLAVFAGSMGAYLLRQHFTKSIPVSGSTQDKLEHFQRYNTVGYAVAEGGNLMSLMLAFIFGNINSFLWFGIGLGIFLLFRPDRSRFIEDYQVNGDFD